MWWTTNRLSYSANMWLFSIQIYPLLCPANNITTCFTDSGQVLCFSYNNGIGRGIVSKWSMQGDSCLAHYLSVVLYYHIKICDAYIYSLNHSTTNILSISPIRSRLPASDLKLPSGLWSHLLARPSITDHSEARMARLLGPLIINTCMALLPAKAFMTRKNCDLLRVLRKPRRQVIGGWGPWRHVSDG